MLDIKADTRAQDHAVIGVACGIRSRAVTGGGILRIQSGADGVWENTLKNIYHDNIPKNVDHVYYCVCFNVRVSSDSPMTGNTKHRVRYANLV